MKAWSTCLILLVLLPFIDSARAGAKEGELFGYRLGARYPLTSQTRTGMVEFFRYIHAERPVKPATISEVTLLTTPRSLQIVAITGLRGFGDRATAWRFFNVGVFPTKVRKTPRDLAQTPIYTKSYAFSRLPK